MPDLASDFNQYLPASYSWPGQHCLALSAFPQAGFLAHRPWSHTAFPVSQWLKWLQRSAYSDEFAQALHLFPYYPALRFFKESLRRHLQILYSLQLRTPVARNLNKYIT